MRGHEAILPFPAGPKAHVPPDALYAVLADPNTHVIWAGKEAPRGGFRLLTIDAPAGPAVVGSTFSSSGSNGKKGNKVSHDRSIVVEAVPGKRFGFDTEASMERKHKEAWRAHFEHRYTIE